MKTIKDQTRESKLESGAYLKKGAKVVQLVDLYTCGAKLDERPSGGGKYTDHAAWFLLDVEEGLVLKSGRFDPKDFIKEGWKVMQVREVILQ